MTYTLTPSGRPSAAVLTALVPVTIPGRQIIRQIEYSHKPTSIETSGYNCYASFSFGSLSEPVDVTIRIRADLLRHDSQAQTDLATLTPADARRYLLPERYIESEAQEIRDLAAHATGQTPLELVRSLYTLTVRTVRPGLYQPRDGGALAAVRGQLGDCTEYADLLVALCRARGIPARVVEGVIADYSDVPRHAWAEAYVGGRWLPLDAALARSGQSSFDRMKPMYLYLTAVRNDDRFGGGHSWYCQYWGRSVEVRETVDVRNVPRLPGAIASTR
jgi:transglutaminase-like putative cysteine protease